MADGRACICAGAGRSVLPRHKKRCARQGKGLESGIPFARLSVAMPFWYLSEYMIQPRYQSLSSLLKEEVRYVVPKYQRPYAWKGEDIGDLVDDLNGYIGKKEGLHLGTIILDSSKTQATLEIVDGQQRLTTLFMLLVACRDHARSLNRRDLAGATQRFITFTDDLENKTVGMRLVASESIRIVFEHIATADWNEKWPDKLGKQAVRRVVNRIRPTYDFFRQQLKTLNAEELIELQRAVYSIGFIRIDIDETEEAFSIFERTNARGVALEVADLLKNYLYRKSVTDIDDLWQQISENAGSSMLRMLKEFYVARSGYVQKATLYKNLKKYADERGAEQFAEQLLDFSKFYHFINTLSTNSEDTKAYFAYMLVSSVSEHQMRYTEAHSSLLALNEFGISQIQPLIYASLLAIKRLKIEDDQKSAKMLVRLLHSLECFHFVNTSICSRIGNETERLYAGFCTEFGTTTDFIDAVDNVCGNLRAKLAPYSEFEANFLQVEHSPSVLSKLAYIFDRLNNFGRKAGEHTTIFYPDASMFRRNFNIEHIFAQGTVVLDQKSIPTSIDNIGNLIILGIGLNSSLGNKSVSEKFELLRERYADRTVGLPTVSDLLKNFGTDAMNWTDDTIKRRAVHLARVAYGEVWKF